jgi:gamma-glutamyltranspeptidase/glutathione hydrolase
MARSARRVGAGLLGLTLAAGLLVGASPPTADADSHAPVRVTKKTPTAYGWGGAVASVDPEATAAGLRVLRDGGNAVDAAVATAAALGVTEPYSAGIGGGGYFVYYDARTRRVQTIDGRETAPSSMTDRAFLDPNGKAYPFEQLVTSGLSVGVPGTPATWEHALQRWGRHSLADNLRPAIRIAERGFVVDPTFRNQTLDNKARFAQITPTAKLYLPGGDAPAVGSVFRNPDLAGTYREMARNGASVLYRGPIASDMANTVAAPPKTPTAVLPVFPGQLKLSDLRAYHVIDRRPTKVRYRHLDVYGMAPSSSGGTTVGEALNILDTIDLGRMSEPRALHYYLDASALAFADRGAYVGDPAYVRVPTQTLLSQRFADSRACQIPERRALQTPTAAGALSGRGCTSGAAAGTNEQGRSTTHLVTSDRWGNVVSYTLTIEQTGGSGIVVPGRGFLLNNELTDFSATPSATDPNTIAGGKRPRSSMSPTIVLDARGKPVYAVGSPGGSTIITTVLQTLVNRIDRGMTLPEAIAAPRASHRNNATVTAEPAFIERYGDALRARDYELVAQAPGQYTPSEIGAVAALEFRPGGYVLAAAEPVRRGGGSAGVVVPTARR